MNVIHRYIEIVSIRCMFNGIKVDISESMYIVDYPKLKSKLSSKLVLCQGQFLKQFLLVFLEINNRKIYFQNKISLPIIKNVF